MFALFAPPPRPVYGNVCDLTTKLLLSPPNWIRSIQFATIVLNWSVLANLRIELVLISSTAVLNSGVLNCWEHWQERPIHCWACGTGEPLNTTTVSNSHIVLEAYQFQHFWFRKDVHMLAISGGHLQCIPTPRILSLLHYAGVMAPWTKYESNSTRFSSIIQFLQIWHYIMLGRSSTVRDQQEQQFLLSPRISISSSYPY